MKSREIRLTSRPEGAPTEKNFELATVEVPDPGPGQVQVRNLCMSVDPYMRGRMMDRKSYVPPFAIGEALQGGAIGRVTASNADGIAEGDVVNSMFGWREAYVVDAKLVTKLPELVAPPSAYLGVLGMPGMTAYVGLLDVAEYRDGDTVFVSGAAGAVGSLVTQIAKLKGSRVVGSAGSAEKVKLCEQEFGCDVAFDYHGGGLPQKLAKAAPDGLDVYFDNVGGDHLQAAIGQMKRKGRIALCGMISQYNEVEPPPGPNNLILAVGMELTLRGFIVSSYMSRMPDFLRDMGGWVQSGKIRWRETVHEGIEKAPDAFIGLFTGENVGKMIVRLAD